ncbi:PEP-CTERM sorting domain-containing protein [Nitrogeniibacter aestuarii]|uniref:PEP-CTERM sorting domain-containing protein n=1 Tax=Nitrogeniibacter aestuarii TaxID=2815343 RepID=UPI001D1107B0|nr:PEP-CTERM sorting domain-containing protein [Nitrogeniibacter aestuarii]
MTRTPFIKTAIAANVAFACIAMPGLASASAIYDRIAAANENTWIQLNLNSYSDAWVDADDRPLRGLTNAPPSKLISAWSSFSWDSNRSDLLLYGGGHANYTGNEVYRFSGTTLTWENVSLPSEVVKVGNSNYLPVDGAQYAPQSAHTYDNSLFLKNADRMMTFGGAAADGGGGYRLLQSDGTVRATGPYLFDPNKADGTKVGGSDGSNVQRVSGPAEGGYMWSNRDSDFAQGRSFINGTTAVDSTGLYDVVYVTARSGGGTRSDLYRYTVVDPEDASLDSWELVGVDWNGVSTKGTAGYDPERQLYVRTGNLSVQNFIYWDLSPTASSNKNQRASFIAPEDFEMNPNLGLDFDPVRNQFLIWGGSDVWALEIPDDLSQPWVITELFDGATGGPNASFLNGVLGKWHYAEDLDVFIALENAVDGNVWAYKPTGWQAVTAVPEPSMYAMLLAGLAIVGGTVRRRL